MAGFISESYVSRPFTLAKTSGRELIYDIQGTEDEAEVQALLLGAVPSTYGGLELESVEAEPVGAGIWKGNAKYTRVSTDEYTFDTGGGTRHVTQSLGTVNSYTASGFPPPDFQGAINVSEDRVEGVDLPSPKYEFSETHYLDDASVTLAYKLILFNLSGQTMNDNTFKGFAAGECAFLGASGAKRGDERWAITYRFACSPNVTGLTVGTITDIEKLGWDYLWIRYAVSADNTAFSLVHRPIAVYVERVLIPADYSTIGIGT